MSLFETDNVYLFIPNLIGKWLEGRFKLRVKKPIIFNFRICKNYFSNNFVLLHAL